MPDRLVNRAGLVINADQMDGILNERCQAFVKAEAGIERTAAMLEFVDDVLTMIELAGSDPRHREELIAQAIFNVEYFGKQILPNQQGRNFIIMDLTQKFSTALASRILEKQYGNSLETGDSLHSQINAARETLRATFKKTVDVFSPNRPELPRPM